MQPADLPGYRLGVDFGTSNTVAVAQAPGVPARAVLFDGFPLLPSSVCVAPDGGLFVGREAVHAARVHPELFEPHPKRRIDDGEILLGDRAYPVAQVIAAVLGRVRAEAVRTMGAAPAATVLTCPAAWGTVRRQVLLDAAAAAGLGTPALVPEPVAAATYFVNALDLRLPVGANVVVYDFGGGTFDASVVRRTPYGWETVASEGLPDAGGLDVDAALVGYISAAYSRSHPAEIQRLEQPDNAGDRRANRLLWDDVRNAKEVLSRATTTYVHLPLIEDDTPIGREQLERLARPILDRTVALTRNVTAGAPPAAVFLVGGSSRVPLVATLLHRALGVAPTAIEQPEIVVAQGSVQVLHPPAPVPVPPQPVPPMAPAFAAAPVSAFPVAPMSPYAAPPAPMPVSAPPMAPFPAPSAPPVPQGPPPPRSPIKIALAAIAGAVAFALLFLDPFFFKNVFLGNWMFHEWTTIALFPAGVAWFASVFGTRSAARRTAGRIALSVLMLVVFTLIALLVIGLAVYSFEALWVESALLGLLTALLAVRLLAGRTKETGSLFGAADWLGTLATAAVFTLGLLAMIGGVARPDLYGVPALLGATAVVGLGAATGLATRSPNVLRKVAAGLLIAGVAVDLIDFVRLAYPTL
ncbi:Hsp70 family protein [Dactylosporangium sp. CA-139066]|uniref:Hsp70 family protein n=1 Tax=Dactylosporangium sp. CA-139066 TaxID=3239930 RepID=UPI003D8ABBA8